MVTPLDLLNRARKKNGNSEVDVSTLEQGSQGSITNIEFVDDVMGIAYEMSYDHGFNDFIEDITLTASTAAVPTSGLSVEWDPNAIKSVHYVDASNANKKSPLTLITPERADKLKQTLTSESTPIYYYIDQEVLYVLPTPDSGYTVTVRFQGLVPEITTDNVNTAIALPRPLSKALVDGIYSRLLHEDGDPEWEKWDARFLQKMQLYLTRNRNNYRNAGLKMFRMKRSRSFKL